jgi:CubicO group peptidase (beta-lactamase class C family)
MLISSIQIERRYVSSYYKYVLIFIFSLVIVAGLNSQVLTSLQIDSIVEKSMEVLPQAGIAIAVVKDGKIVHSKGYGFTSIETQNKVDENTLFAIASNTKAFTSAALAILVDENKLSWDDKVVDFIPEFRMYDPYVTENFSILDLLTHRSGLGSGAGDLMIFPDGSDFTVNDVVRSFQYQSPVSAFRTTYDYDNLLYIVAGEVVKRVSGTEYTTFVQTRILTPLGMINSASSFAMIRNRSNIAAPHSLENGALRQINTYSHNLTNPAGGIYTSINDLSKWLLVQLNRGRYGEELEKELFSEAAQMEMWKPHTNINFRLIADGRYNKHFTAYGLGWEISDYCGYVALSHGGGLPGMLSQTTLIPELNLGVTVLTNSQPGGLSYFTLTWAILDSYLGVEKRDWIAFAEETLQASQSDADSVTSAVWETVEKSKTQHIDLGSFTGTYRDDWFGKVEIIEEGGRLWFHSLRSPKLSGEMFYYKASTFVIKWNYTDMPCDSFAIFNYDTEGKAVSIIMRGISPEIDFSFDFQDLNLARVSEE